METSLEIPVPAASDSESVVTALEMAALFGKKGEEGEAVRWLKRAAESAGEEGDDSRALALARTAAEFTDRLRAASERPPLPTPPAAPTSLRPPPPSERAARGAEGEAEPIPLGRRTTPPKSASTTPSSGPRLPTPPSRPASATPSAPRVTTSPTSMRPAQTPAAPSVRPTPSSFSRAQGSESSAPVSNARPPGASSKSSPTSASAFVKNAIAGASVDSSASSKSALNGNGRASSVRPDGPKALSKSVRMRQTARVSVTPGHEPGVYIMRLLDDEETTLPGRAVEGLLVLTDPKAKLPE